MLAIDTLCSLCLETPSLQSELREMYPFLTDEVLAKKGIQRYNKIADLIENMEQPMYASSIELDQLKITLSRRTGANLTLVTINTIADMKKILEAAHTKYVAYTRLLCLHHLHP